MLTIVLTKTADDTTLPLPLLYFRTALRALKQYPRLKDKLNKGKYKKRKQTDRHAGWERGIVVSVH